MSEPGLKDLLQAGLHFGHQTQALEPAHAPLHPRRARRDPHHRPAADGAAAQPGARLRGRGRRQGRLGALRRDQEAGARLGQGLGRALRDAVRQPALARRPADQLPDDVGAHRPPARAHRAQGRRSARAAADQGADVDGGRAREARVQPRRRPRHEAPAAGGADHRPEDRGDRGRRGDPAAGSRSSAWSTPTSIRSGVAYPDPGQRRLDALLRDGDRDDRRGGRERRDHLPRGGGQAPRRGGGQAPRRGGGQAQARGGGARAQGGRGGGGEGRRGRCAAAGQRSRPSRSGRASPAGEPGPRRRPRRSRPPRRPRAARRRGRDGGRGGAT